MSRYKIDYIKIHNFKSIHSFERDFKEDILILDGPNGYGKTTLFDAIELVMFGKIRRIDNFEVDGRLRYRDPLLSEDPSKDSIVQVRFAEVNPTSESTETSFVVTKRLPAPGIQLSRNNSPRKWLFKTYITSDFPSDFNHLEVSTQEDVYQKLGEPNLGRTFHLFHYVQQEDKTFFLRQDEKQRLKELSALFDTTKEMEERQKIQTVFKKVKSTHDRLVEELQQLEEERKSLSSENKPEDGDISYAPLLLGDTQPEWDQPLSTLSKEARDTYIDELNDVSYFIEDFKSFKRALHNEEYENYAYNDELLRNTILSGFFIDSRENLKELYNRQREYMGIKSKLETSNIDLFVENQKLVDDTVRIAKNLNVVFEELEVTDIINGFRDQHKVLGELSTLVVNVNNARERLKSSYEKFLDHQHEGSGVCPLCGANYGEYKGLLEELTKRRKYFETFYGENEQRLVSNFTKFRNGFVENVIQAIGQYLNDESHDIDEEFYKQFDEAFKEKQSTADFTAWCMTKELSLMDYVNKQARKLEDPEIEQMVAPLRDYLLVKLLDVPNKVIQNNKESFKYLKRIYQNVFRNADNAVARISLEMIEEKKDYINYVFYNSNTERILEIEKKHNAATNQFDRCQELLHKLKEILGVYDSYIQKHWAKIIEDIEIVFYIYCGKIMQYYPRGIGMFIKPFKGTFENERDEAAESITFTYSVKSDHDAINFLSSGQLSALVIAFTLSLHRVYGNKGLNTIFIDDPVQTMDDINMASLTELLRNDFGDKQILLSTHEDDVSRYLVYKFTRYGLNAESVGMKEVFVEQRTHV